MDRQESTQLRIYPDEAAIPRYQRAWVWGVATLAVLLCGLIAGWLFAGGASPAAQAQTKTLGGSVDGAALLARQEAVNSQLRERIARLERTLGGDVCGPEGLNALTGGLQKP